jgi:hypothetical protein
MPGFFIFPGRVHAVDAMSNGTGQSSELWVPPRFSVLPGHVGRVVAVEILRPRVCLSPEPRARKPTHPCKSWLAMYRAE